MSPLPVLRRRLRTAYRLGIRRAIRIAADLALLRLLQRLYRFHLWHSPWHRFPRGTTGMTSWRSWTTRCLTATGPANEGRTFRVYEVIH